jgi:hypothetical protein
MRSVGVYACMNQRYARAVVKSRSMLTTRRTDLGSIGKLMKGFQKATCPTVINLD